MLDFGPVYVFVLKHMLIHTFLDRPAKQGDRLLAILSQKTKVFEKHSSMMDDIESTAKKQEQQQKNMRVRAKLATRAETRRAGKESRLLVGIFVTPLRVL